MSTPASGRFNLSSWTLRHQSFVTFVLVLLTLLGIGCYTHLSQSEDPPFTFKIMVIQTEWPGATASQVQEQITDRIARKLQETPDIDYLRSYSRPGQSQLFFSIKDSAPASHVPDTWYQVRKKVGDITATLPPGVRGPYFNDEFGDVYTNIYSLEGDGFSPAQLHDYADKLRVELLRVPGVAKIDYFGDRNQHIYIDISNAQMTRLGITPKQLGELIGAQNAVAPGGLVTTASDRLYIRPSGQFDDVQAIRDKIIRINNRNFRLGDIATVTRGYDEPQEQQMRANNKPVLGIGITMQPGGDVIRLGKALDERIATLNARLPAGLKLTAVSSMPHAVEKSVDDFLEAVAEAVAIVLLVSLMSLGVRTGMVVVISIPIVLAVTALFMYMFDIGLHKVSLGTLVLALGLLVDDAIIAVEMMAVKLEQGWNRHRAAAFAYTSTAFPMLTGTLVTVSGFLPIALAKSSTGEYTRSIFEVSAIALLLSWLAAVVLIPLLGYHMLKEKPQREDAGNDEGSGHASEAHEEDHDHAIYQTRIYTALRHMVLWCVAHRGRVVVFTALLFLGSLAAFRLVPQQFFPSSDRPELLIDLRMPERASFEATQREAIRLENLLKDRPEIDHVADFVGTGAPRFYLSLDQQLPSTNFAQFVVTAKSVEDREKLSKALEVVLREQFGGLRTRLTRLENGVPVGFPVQFRVSGEKIPEVRAIAEKVAAEIRKESRAINVQFDWDEPAQRSITFEVDQQRVAELGLTSQQVSDFLAMNLSGYTVTQYRERDKLISVDLRAPRNERVDPSHLDSLAIPTPSGSVPLSTLGHIRNELEYGVIWERDRQPTITVQADVLAGVQGIDVSRALDGKLDQLRRELPIGYRIDVGGPLEENTKAQASISKQMPLMVIAVLVLLMMQLQSVGRTMMVVMTAPIGLIGVIGALLLFHQPFGFVAMLGTIAMFGIIMRNSVILVDQIEQDIAAGRKRLDAIVGATVRRFRPITLTAAAAVLALIPLLRSNFFGPMATALMGGITVATVLTLFYLPALYALCYKIKLSETDSVNTGAKPATLPEGSR